MMKKECSVTPEKKNMTDGEEAPCAQVPIIQETCGLTGAGEDECVLSIR